MKVWSTKNRVFLLLLLPVTVFALAIGIYFSAALDTRGLLVVATLWLVSFLTAFWLARRFTTGATTSSAHPPGQQHLMTDVMHEIQAPMHTIDEFTSLLLNSRLDPDQLDHVRTIRQTSRNMIAVLNNALKMDQPGCGDFSINAVAFNLRECIDDVIAILTPAIHKKELDVIIFIYSDVPEAVIFDPLLLRQILINLIDNAIKFTPRGNIVVRVMLEEETAQDVQLKITVTDTGVGIAENSIPDLFKPSTPAESSDHGSSEHGGPGLPVCKKIIEKIGGDIGASSTSCKGAEFWFTLHCIRSNSARLMRTYPVMQRKNIVLYDSNETSLLALRHDLTSTGAHPISVNRLQEVPLVPAKGKDIFWKIDAVYLSLRQHECHDDAVTESIERICAGYQCPVIVLSYCNAASIIENMYAAGIACHMLKPVRLSEIASALAAPYAHMRRLTSPHFRQDRTDVQPSVDIKVLVAEDNTINARLISAILGQCGISPIMVSNGRDAIEMLEKNDIDIILMDIHMPVMDGLDATRYIRKQLASDVPIIAVTANAVPGEIERFFAAGIDECLIKPIRTHQLFRLFKQYLAVDLAPDYQAMNEIQRDILMAEDTSVSNDLMKYKARILTCMREKDREKLLGHVHKLNGIASFFRYDALRKHVDELETAIKNEQSFDLLRPLAERVYGKIDDTLKSRRAG